jgi:hypothetical protein
MTDTTSAGGVDEEDVHVDTNTVVAKVRSWIQRVGGAFQTPYPHQPLLESSRASAPHRTREYRLAHPPDAARSNLATALTQTLTQHRPCSRAAESVATGEEVQQVKCRARWGTEVVREVMVSAGAQGPVQRAQALRHRVVRVHALHHHRRRSEDAGACTGRLRGGRGSARWRDFNPSPALASRRSRARYGGGSLVRVTGCSPPWFD